MVPMSTQPRTGTPTGSPNPNRAWNPPLDVARQRLVTMVAEMGTAQAAHVIVTCVLGPGSEGLCTGTKAPERNLTQSEALDAMVARAEARRASELVGANA